MNKSEVIVEIKLESGNYTINSLLKKINNFLEINYKQYNIKLKLDDTYKINIVSDNNFKILETNLSHDVFGFLNENDYSKKIPAYLFKEKGFLIDLFRRFNSKKKILLLNLLSKTEYIFKKRKCFVYIYRS